MDVFHEKQIILKLQDEFPLVPEPYKKIADDIGIPEKELLDYITELKNNKTLRRIGAVLNHRTAGFPANAMVAWVVPAERIKEVSDIMISIPQVSHCYEREVLKNWNYNIYTMIHSVSFELCDKLIKQISQMTNINNYEVLYSTKELKKSSMVYSGI
ncbi:siroheme decarboxylase subunit beta [Clostridium sp. Marseille-P2415]|uniref:siroheme decarboxylase subunit beta n=1 Tax=Clostridium sp. Marseille-P2415 TaxID=1805471 RepID=UPI0009889281|nr:Lrp/AsnC family transcriptional regulator [Clostridium sp. Marseille-P2415]